MARRIGVAFDIDGVLLRGKRALPGAANALKELLFDCKIPVVLMTNGGGVLESVKARQVEELLGLEKESIDPDKHVILSHSPMKNLQTWKQRRVLIMGCRDELNVARSYGFEKIVSPQEFCAQHRDLYPFKDHEPTVEDPYRDEKVEGILIMHDPVDWHLEMQVCCDLLHGLDPLSSSFSNASGGSSSKPEETNLGQKIPIFNSNDDFVFAGAYEHPRFAQGAFVESLSNLYSMSCPQNSELRVERFGKPHQVTYDFAEELLRTQLEGVDGGPFDTIYMIGDNPAADIAGANSAGNHWKSVLVETGVYQNGADTGNPDFLVPSVQEALDLIRSNL